MTTQQINIEQIEETFVPYNGTRTDIHRPSAINPEDYTYVGIECLPGVHFGPVDLGACQILNHNRMVIREHMARTGGQWSNHQHGGNCHVCGAHAIYTVCFYHAATNTYIRTGFDCAEKMDMADASVFRTHRAITGEVKDAREYAKGKAKAQAILAEAGLSEAWKFFAETDTTVRYAYKYEEVTIADMVGKLVRFGSISDKAMAFMGRLLAAIPARAEKAAAQAAKKAAAADCPVGRVTIVGTIVSMKLVDTQFGTTEKMLVKHESGYKVWGTVPSNLTVEKGAVVAFDAKVEQSKDDRSFGFYSRPTKASVLTPAVVNA